LGIDAFGQKQRQTIVSPADDAVAAATEQE